MPRTAKAKKTKAGVGPKRSTARATTLGINLLITGFGPFPGAPDNPTGPLVRALARRLRMMRVMKITSSEAMRAKQISMPST